MTSRILVGAFGVVLLLALIWAWAGAGSLHGGIGDQYQVLTTIPFGVAALLNLIVGYGLFALIIVLVERSWLAGALWAAPIFFLGNLWAAVWLVVRLPTIARRLSAGED